MRWLLALALALCSCAPFHFERQRIFLRHDAQADTLDLLLVFENVSQVAGGHGEEPRARHEAVALGAIRQIASGGQRFLVLDWPWDLDLEALRRKAEVGEWPRPPGDDLLRRLIAHAGDIHVRSAGLCGDREGRIALLQRVRVSHASDVLAIFNEAAGWATQEGEWGGSGQEARRAWARAGKAWLAFAPDGTLDVACPVSPAEAAALLRSGRDPEFDAYTQLLASLTRLDIDDGVLRMAFAPRADGWIVFDVRFPGRALTPAVARELLAHDDLEPGPLDLEVQRLLEAE